MSIDAVDMDRALTSQAYAQQVLRSGKVGAEQQGQLAAKWGADNVNKWLSVDSTDYRIDDEDFENAKESGKDKAKEATGYDGGKTGRAVVDAVESAGAAVAANTVGKKLVGKIAGSTQDQITSNTLTYGKNKTAKLSDIATVVLSSVVAAQYYIAKPNKEQHDAGVKLYEEELPNGQGALMEAQDVMEEASEEITEKTEEAAEKNEEANEIIEEKKTLFDIQKLQREDIKAKKEAGETLTPDQQALLRDSSEEMKTLGEDINTTKDETSEEVNEINDDIAEYQDTFDESGETIAEVEGVTEYAEGFDENARTMMYVETAAQGVNAFSAGVATGRLAAKNLFGVLTPFIVMGGAATIGSLNAVREQWGWAGDMSDEIHARRDLQDYNAETTDMYEEELDNYAGNIETVEDLEIEMPKDLEVEPDTTLTANQTPESASLLTIANNNKNDKNSKNNANNNTIAAAGNADNTQNNDQNKKNQIL